jgi:crotonobetainyl-CoA:carnitine CoA-transferase CaiB-like acyl-CoA transferase
VVIAANQDTVFVRLAAAMGAPELARDPAYASHTARGAHQAELDDRIGAWTAGLTMVELEQLCDAHGVPFGRVYRAPEMLADPHFAARQAIVEVPHPVLGSIKMQNVAPKFSATPGQVRWAGKAPGADDAWAYGTLLGYPPDKIAALVAAGAISPQQP